MTDNDEDNPFFAKIERPSKPFHATFRKVNPDINEMVGDEYDIGDTADIQAFIKIQRAFLDADYSRDKVTTEQYERESRFWERIENQSLAIQDVLAIHEIDEDNYTLRYAGNDNQVEYETCQCGDDYPCSTRTAITKRLGRME